MNKKLKKSNYTKLLQIYDTNGKKRKFNISYDEASKMSSNNLNAMSNYIGSYKIKVTNIKVSKLRNRYENIKINSNFVSFINEISKSFKSYKYNNIDYDLFNPIIEISHDFMGNKLNSNIYLSLVDKKISIVDDKILKFKVYEIFDNSNKIKLIIDFNTLQYLGYRKGSNFFNMRKVNIYHKYIPSIKEIFETIGFKKNIYDFESFSDVKQTIFYSVNNLKSYIRDMIMTLNIIKFKTKNSYDNITKYFITRIDNIKLSEFKHNAFSDYDLINKFTFINIKNISELKNVTKYDLINMTNDYKKLLDYLISELLFIININKNKYLKVNIISLFLSFIIDKYYYKFNQYYDFKLIRYTNIIKSDLINEIKENTVILTDEDNDDKLTEEQKNIRDDVMNDNEEKNDSRDIDLDINDDIGADNDEDVIDF